MATLESKNTRIPRTGGLYEAPLGTPWPTDTTTPLSVEWLGWGWVGPEGITESVTSSLNDLKGWQEDGVVDQVASDSSANYQVPALETRKHIIETAFGTTVDEANGSYTIKPGAPKPRRLFCYEVIDLRDGAKSRKMFEAAVSEIGDTNYTATELVNLALTLNVFGDIQVIDDKLKATGTEA